MRNVRNFKRAFNRFYPSLFCVLLFVLDVIVDLAGSIYNVKLNRFYTLTLAHRITIARIIYLLKNILKKKPNSKILVLFFV